MIDQIIAELKQQYPGLPEEVIMDAIQKMGEIDPEGLEGQMMAEQGIQVPGQEMEGYEMVQEEPAMDAPMDPNLKEKDALSKLFG
jgi:hypothetical protein